MFIMETLLALLLGWVADLILGDPHWLWHPVQGIGFMISQGEKILRRLLPGKEFAAGAILTVLVVGISFGVPFGLLWLAGMVSPWLRFALEAFFCCQILATKRCV